MWHDIGLFFRFLYHFFFIDQQDGRLSHTKFFSVIGYLIWCWAFPYTVINGSKASFELWMVFGAVVIGNRTLQTIMVNKSGGQRIDESATWKGKMKDEFDDNDDSDNSNPTPPVVVVPPVIHPAVPPVTKSAAPVVPDTSDLVDGTPSHK